MLISVKKIERDIPCLKWYDIVWKATKDFLILCKKNICLTKEIVTYIMQLFLTSSKHKNV